MSQSTNLGDDPSSCGRGRGCAGCYTGSHNGLGQGLASCDHRLGLLRSGHLYWHRSARRSHRDGLLRNTRTDTNSDWSQFNMTTYIHNTNSTTRQCKLKDKKTTRTTTHHKTMRDKQPLQKDNTKTRDKTTFTTTQAGTTETKHPQHRALKENIQHNTDMKRYIQSKSKIA